MWLAAEVPRSQNKGDGWFAQQKLGVLSSLSLLSTSLVLQYGEAEYWDHRYQAEPVFFDWYLSFPGLEPVLKQHVPLDANILQVGGMQWSVSAHCGTLRPLLLIRTSAVAVITLLSSCSSCCADAATAAPGVCKTLPPCSIATHATAGAYCSN